MRMKSWMIVAVLLLTSSMTYAQQPAGVSRLQREMADLQADLEGARQDVRALQGRIVELEQENRRKDSQLKSMQNLLGAMEQRLREFEKSFSKALEEERASRRQELKGFAQEISRELESGGGRPSVPAYTGKYKELVVEQGDTLSIIAKTCGTTVDELKAINNLKNDNIRIGQKLKIPMK